MIDGEDDEIEVEIPAGDDDEQEVAAKPEGEDGEAAETGENDDGEDELVVEIEGLDEPPVEETPLAKKLRHEIRDRDRRIMELERGQQVAVETEVGPEPDLWEDCDGDPETYKTKLMDWNTRKVAAETRKFEAQQAEQRARERFDVSLATMRSNAAKLGVPGYQEAEEAVGAALPTAIGNAIPVYFGDRAAPLVKALHAHPQLLEKITETAKTDIVQALFDLWDLSKGVKMVPKRKTGAKAEEIVRGSASLSVVPADKKLAELEKAVDAGKPGAQEALMSFLRGKRKADRAAA